MASHDGGSASALARGGLDRSESERDVPGLVDELRSAAGTRALAVAGDRAPMAGADALDWRDPTELPDGGEWAFLGRGRDGAALLAAVYPAADDELFAADGGWGSLRIVGAGLGDLDADSFVTALSLGRWLLDARYCPACGSAALLEQAGWSRRCPSCGRQHFPRTDPAVIVAVESATDPDRLLLGSNAMWGPNRYSCFAGFVEAGESLESAVRREVAEEAGVHATRLRYRGSQAWPYPRSLMLGFLATAEDDAAARPDGEEILEVRWFRRSEVAAALAGEGELWLPGPASIAHRLIADWLAGAA